MIVSWNWLQDYLRLDMDPAEVAQRLAMAGLNHEGTRRVGQDLAIDLEVTSNRPDCLGHIGIAREIAVLWQLPLAVSSPRPPEAGPPIDDFARVILESPSLCTRYTARLVRGVTVGPSPAWLTRRLQALGVSAINNVADITNYVLMECGQPLHAFDLAMLSEGTIIVREARQGETFRAIDHRAYELQPGMCVIADARQPVALGGVMGGADSEITSASRDVLIEAADFAPLSIRSTARSLNLHSPSSYRFERGVDPAGVDWASRRCCELMLELAGGQLCQGVIAVGNPPPERPPIVLRLSQIPRVLGIDIPREEVRRILGQLGCQELADDDASLKVRPPSWRRDLTREIDLVEEAGRIHGYDAIPENVSVPMAPSHRSRQDRVLTRVRHVLAAAGFDEALTASVVPAEWSQAFSPWTDAPPLQCNTPLLKGADCLRRSLLPSLLDTRRLNEALANPVIELFEIARVYLPLAEGQPLEQLTLGLVSDGDFYRLKGAVETLVAEFHCVAELRAISAPPPPLLEPSRSCELWLGEFLLGSLGELTPAARRKFSLRTPAAVAELKLQPLTQLANLAPQHAQQSPYPAITRDLNVILEESVRWADLAATVRQSGGSCLEHVQFQEIYRDPTQDGPNKKRLLLSIRLRAPQRTLTNEEADEIRGAIVTAIGHRHRGQLLGENA